MRHETKINLNQTWKKSFVLWHLIHGFPLWPFINVSDTPCFFSVVLFFLSYNYSERSWCQGWKFIDGNFSFLCHSLIHSLYDFFTIISLPFLQDTTEIQGEAKLNRVESALEQKTNNIVWKKNFHRIWNEKKSIYNFIEKSCIGKGYKIVYWTNFFPLSLQSSHKWVLIKTRGRWGVEKMFIVFQS